VSSQKEQEALFENEFELPEDLGVPVDLSFLDTEMKEAWDKALENAKKVKMELLGELIKVSPEKGIRPSNRTTPLKSDNMLDLPADSKERLFEYNPKAESSSKDLSNNDIPNIIKDKEPDRKYWLKHTHYKKTNIMDKKDS
jgi:hypothetical protein